MPPHKLTASQLLSLLALAPAVYGITEPIAQLEVANHDLCPHGNVPTSEATKTHSLVATKDTCGKAKVRGDHGMMGYYSVSGKLIGDETSWVCKGVGVYTSEDCSGMPVDVLPIDPYKTEIQSRCIRSDLKQKDVGLKLLCRLPEDHWHSEEGKPGHAHLHGWEDQGKPHPGHPHHSPEHREVSEKPARAAEEEEPSKSEKESASTSSSSAAASSSVAPGPMHEILGGLGLPLPPLFDGL